MAKSIFEIYKKISAERKAKLNDEKKLLEAFEIEAELRRKEWRNYLKKNERVAPITLSQSSSSAAGAGGGRISEQEAGNSYVDDAYIDGYFV